MAHQERYANMVDLEKLLLRLGQNQVEFVIVGGVAATVHGSTYVTYDLDFCYARDTSNLERLAKALGPLNPRLRDAPESLPFVWDARTLCQGLNFTLTTDLGEVDLLGKISGIGPYDEVRSTSIDVELFGIQFAVLSLDGLIAAKPFR